jgi:hypothetical protein
VGPDCSDVGVEPANRWVGPTRGMHVSGVVRLAGGPKTMKNKSDLLYPFFHEYINRIWARKNS